MAFRQQVEAGGAVNTWTRPTKAFDLSVKMFPHWHHTIVLSVCDSCGGVSCSGLPIT